MALSNARLWALGALVTALLAALLPSAAARAGYAAEAIVPSSLKDTVHQMEGADFVCPLNIYDVLPASNISLPLPCDADKCEDLRGKVALITGGSTGIGRGTADRLVRAGMRVVATSRTPEKYTQPCGPDHTFHEPGDLCAPAGFDLWQLDQTSQASVDALIQKVKAKYGRIDLLFLNAGRGAGEPMFSQEVNLGPMGSIGYTGCNMLAVRRYNHVILTSSVYAREFAYQRCCMCPFFLPRGVEALAEAWMTEMDGKTTNVKVTTLYPGEWGRPAGETARARQRVKGAGDPALAAAARSPPSPPHRALLSTHAGNVKSDVIRDSVVAGEAVYRIAVDPSPPKRVLMAHPDAVPFFLKRICRHLALPMERWVPVGWNRVKADGSSASSQGLMPTVWGLLIALMAGLAHLSRAGLVTHYGGAQDGMDPNSLSFGTKDGACGYGTIPKDAYPYFAVAALSKDNQFYKAGPLNGCGECFEIQCVDARAGACNKDSSGAPKSVVVMISDACPQCEADHIDMQSLSFAKLASPALGRIDMQYRRVECTPPDDMKASSAARACVAVLDYRGAGGWVRLSIDTTGGRGSVQSVAVKNSASASWQQLANSWGAQWETASAPSAPLDFKIQCDDGETVVASGVIKQAGISAPLGSPIKFATGVQFTITDPSFAGNGGAPGGGRVAAFDGPPDSSAAPAGEGGAAGAAPAALPCVDMPAPGSFSCTQQRDWGKCSDPFMVSGGYCSATCGRCTPARPGAGAAPLPAPEPAPAGGGGCVDTPPPGSFGCAQQRDWGKCSDAFMTAGNYCSATCGRCGAARPGVQSFGGPSGRRLLRRQ
eukprot:scaffold7.g3760.t1